MVDAERAEHARDGQQGPRRAAGERSTTPVDVEVLEELQEISADALAKQGEEAPVVRLVNVVLMSAIQKGASDIHIEPYEKELRVRYRIDGILYNIMSPPMKFRDAISSRIKIMSKLDIAEKRLPQDGRIKIRFNEKRRRRRKSTSASRSCRRSSARRSSCVCSTKTS